MRQALQGMLLCVSRINFSVVQLYIEILSALCTNGRKDLIVKNIESVDALCFLITLPSAQIGCAE